MAAGETLDVVIAPPAATDQFLKVEKVESGGVDVGRVGLGAAVIHWTGARRGAELHVLRCIADGG